MDGFSKYGRLSSNRQPGENNMAGETELPEKMKQIVEVCLGKNVFVGNFTETIPQTEMWTGQGLRYMSYSVDVGILCEAGKALLSDFNRMRRPGGR